MLYKSKLDSSKLTMTAFSFLLYTPLQEYTQVGSKLYLRIRLIKKDLLLIRNTHLLSVNSLSGILNDITSFASHGIIAKERLDSLIRKQTCFG